MKKGGKFVEDLSKMMDMGFSLFFKQTNKQTTTYSFGCAGS